MSKGYEFNKIAMAVLLVGTGTLALQILANDVIFKPEKPKQPGFAVAVAAPTPAAGAGGAAAAAPGPQRPIGEIMASATASAGQAVFRQCASCHTVDKGGRTAAGPNLWGILDRAKASVGGFNYSAAARAKANEKWGYEQLYAYIENPRGYLPGTTMSFAGIRSSQQRADLIAYLREQADTPVALPGR